MSQHDDFPESSSSPSHPGNTSAEPGHDAERFRLLVESVQDYAIFTLDPKGTVLTWNPGARRLKGYSANEIIGQDYSKFYPASDVAAGKTKMLLQRAETDGRVEDEGWRVRKDGSRFWASVVISAMRDPNGTLLGFAKVTRDLTERRRAEESRLRLAQIEEALRVREEFLAYVSHEMRTPLSSMALQVELLRRDPTLSSTPKQKEMLERIARAYKRINDLVDSILQHARAQAGQVVSKAELLDLNTVAAEAMEELRPEADRKGLQLTLSRCADHCLVQIDPRYLSVILTNLIGNAVKFSSHGTIEVKVIASADDYRISVRDEGPGIKAEDRERIFQPFERLESMSNKHTSGFGLGLSTCKRLSEVLGARLELDSEPGRGSTFTIVMPKISFVREIA